MEILAQADTNIGRKKRSNEDTFLIDHDLRLFVVADGMGGHAAGEVASAQAADSIKKIVSEGLMVLPHGGGDETRK